MKLTKPVSLEESQMTTDANTSNLWGAPRQLKRPARDTKQHVHEATLLIDTMHQKLRNIYKASQELENTEQTGMIFLHCGLSFSYVHNID
jgi:hypothetical protein